MERHWYTHSEKPKFSFGKPRNIFLVFGLIVSKQDVFRFSYEKVSFPIQNLFLGRGWFSNLFQKISKDVFWLFDFPSKS